VSDLPSILELLDLEHIEENISQEALFRKAPTT
jgi:hypothetical protein